MSTLAHGSDNAVRLAAAGIRIGTAGWSIPHAHAIHFPAAGTQLARYAHRFNVVEINTSFHRSHRDATYQRWAATVPAHFRFSVKAPKTITHESRLNPTPGLLASFLSAVRALGDKLGVVLFQLPPSLPFEPAVVATFFARLREQFCGAVAFEPRHPTWFEPAADALLCAHDIARVAADPPRGECADRPGGAKHVLYYRLHGTPRTYYSSYGAPFLDHLAASITAHYPSNIWCIFDNTTLGAATANAVDLSIRLLTPQG